MCTQKYIVYTQVISPVSWTAVQGPFLKNLLERQCQLVEKEVEKRHNKMDAQSNSVEMFATYRVYLMYIYIYSCIIIYIYIYNPIYATYFRYNAGWETLQCCFLMEDFPRQNALISQMDALMDRQSLWLVTEKLPCIVYTYGIMVGILDIPN